MSTGVTRCAVIGAGAFGLEHLDALTRTCGAEVAAVCDPNVDVANRAAELFRVKRIFDDPDAVLSSRSIDAVIIASPSPTHTDIALRAIAAGKHVLVEKPVAMTAAEALELEQAAAQNPQVVCLPGHVLRHSRPHRRICQAVQEGEVGRVQSFIASRDRERGHHERYSDTSPTLLTMIHDIDMALWMTGQTPVAVSAVASHDPGRAQPSVVSALVSTREGSTWSLSASWALPKGAPNEDRLRILGTAGCITWRNEPEFQLRRAVDAVGPLSEPDRLFATEIDDEIEHFISLIREGVQSDRVSMGEATMGIKVAAAVNTSIERNGERQEI